MKIKVFSSISESTLEKKVNDFLSNQDIEIVKVSFQAHIFGYAVQILYKQKG